MQTPVTVVMLLHDTATEADQPVCKVLTGCSWRETRRTSASGDPQRVVHIRLPPAPGYLPYPQWARLPSAEKAAHWTLKRGSKLLCGTVRSLTEAEYAALEKNSHLLYGGGCLGRPGRPAAAFSCGRELTPHVQAHF